METRVTSSDPAEELPSASIRCFPGQAPLSHSLEKAPERAKKTR